MGLAVLVECREHDWQDDGCVVADEGHDVLIVPVVQLIAPMFRIKIYSVVHFSNVCVESIKPSYPPNHDHY